MGSKLSLRRVFASPTLEGLWGIAPVRASEDWKCGAAALVTVMRYLKRTANESQVVDEVGMTKAGCTPEAIITYLHKKSFRVMGTHETPFHLIIQRIRRRLPYLLMWMDKPGQWLVGVGADLTERVGVFADPTDPDLFVARPLDDFEEDWNKTRRVCISITPFKHLNIHCKRSVYNRLVLWKTPAQIPKSARNPL